MDRPHPPWLLRIGQSDAHVTHVTHSRKDTAMDTTTPLVGSPEHSPEHPHDPPQLRIECPALYPPSWTGAGGAIRHLREHAPGCPPETRAGDAVSGLSVDGLGTRGILLLGEAPGEDEVRERQGFVGRSGQLLQRLCQVAGLEWDRLARSNVAKRRPPNNDFKQEFYLPGLGKSGKPIKARTQPTHELLGWHRRLSEELQDMKPSVVVALGNEALYAVQGLREISQRRGSCYPPSPGVPFWTVAALHPASLLHGAQWQEIPILLLALQRAKFLAETPLYRPRAWQHTIYPLDEAKAVLSHITGPYGLDIETIPGDVYGAGKVRSIAIAWHPEDDPADTMAAVWSWPRGREFWSELTQLFRRNPNMIGHNLLYDFAWLEKEGVTVPDHPQMDTMQAFRRLEMDLPKGLGFVNMWYSGLDLPWYKDEGKHGVTHRTPEEELQYLEYNAKDAIATLWASEKIIPEMQKAKILGNYQSQGQRLFALAQAWQRRGLPLDQDEIVHLILAVSQAEYAVLEELQEDIPEIENFNSTKQVQDYLKSRGIKIPTNKAGADTLDEQAVLGLVHEGHLPVRLLHLRKMKKLLSTYLRPMSKAGEIMRCGWNPDSTETLRWAGNEHPLGGGLNAQTIPKEIRHLIAPPPGFVFLGADLEQAEARYVAYCAGVRAYIALFEDPTRHIHLERAKQIFGRVVEKDSPDYVLGKRSLHAGNYGMGPQLFAADAQISLAKAKMILGQTHRIAPEIKKWHGLILEQVRQRGTLTNAWGHVFRAHQAAASLMITGKISGDVHRSLIAWEPQSGATTPIINRFLLALEDWSEWQSIHHGHDSFLAMVPEYWLDSPHFRTTMTQLLQPTLTLHYRDFIIPANLVAGWNWGCMIPWKGNREETKLAWEREWAKKKPTLHQILEQVCYLPGLEFAPLEDHAVDSAQVQLLQEIQVSDSA